MSLDHIFKWHVDNIELACILERDCIEAENNNLMTKPYLKS